MRFAGRRDSMDLGDRTDRAPHNPRRTASGVSDGVGGRLAVRFSADVENAANDRRSTDDGDGDGDSDRLSDEEAADDA